MSPCPFKLALPLLAVHKQLAAVSRLVRITDSKEPGCHRFALLLAEGNFHETTDSLVQQVSGRWNLSTWRNKEHAIDRRVFLS
jgi:hypothetical protein